MKISLITVSYNSEKTIARTIESVLAQDYPDMEYIIIDGASADTTMAIVRGYEAAFRQRGVTYLTQSEPDGGIYDAMNKGIARASGGIIGILNSDDYLADSAALSAVAECFDSHNCDTVYGNLVMMKNDKPYRYWRSGKPRTFRYGWMPPHPAFFVRTEIYRRYGTFRLDCGVNADYELMLRLLEKEHVSVHWLDRTLVCMTAGGVSNNGVRSRIQGIADNRQAWRCNNMRLPFYTVYLKKLRKIPQFVTARFVRIK